MYMWRWLVAVIVILGLVAVPSAHAFEPELTYSYSCLMENNSDGVVIREIAADTAGNLYITGYFGYDLTEADFDCSENEDIHSDGGASSAVFTTKYNADGTYGWTKVITGTGFGGEGKSLAVYGGKVYVGGMFSGSNIDFDDSEGSDVISSAGSYDSFVTVYTTSGDYQNTYRIGGTSQEGFYKLAIDGNGDVIVIGIFSGTVDFDLGAGTTELTAPHLTTYFAKYNADFSTLEFAYKLQGPDMFNRPIVYGLTIDKDDNIIFAGDFTGTDVDLDATDGTDLYSTAAYDAYFSKYSAAGEYQWSRRIGRNANYETAYDVATDSEGNVYVVGSAGAGFTQLDMDATDGTDFRVPTLTDGYLTKYGPDGSYFDSYLYSSDDVVETKYVVVDAEDNVYVLGEFTENNAELDGTAGGTDFDSFGEYDTYLTKYTQDLTFEWTKRYGGTYYDSPFSMATDGTSQLYLAISASSLGSNDFFIDGLGTIDKGSETYPIIVAYTADSAHPTVSLNEIGETDDNKPTLRGTATDIHGTVTGVSYQVDSAGTWIACTANDVVFDEAVEPFSCKVNTALTLGAHTIYFYTSDSHGNEGVTVNSLSITIKELVVVDTTEDEIDTTRPVSFPIIYASDITSESVTIKFLPGAGAVTNYILEYGRNSKSFEYGVNPIGDGNSREFEIGGLSANTTYYFKLTPVNNGTSGPSSPVYSAKTLKKSDNENPGQGGGQKKKPPEEIDEIKVVDLVDEVTEATQAGEIVEVLVIAVVDEEDEPIQEAQVTLIPESVEEDQEDLAGTTDDEGEVVFNEVVAGEYTVIVDTTDGRHYEEVIVLSASEAKMVQIVVKADEQWTPETAAILAKQVLAGGVTPKQLLEERLGVPPEVGTAAEQTAEIALMAIAGSYGLSLLVGAVGVGSTIMSPLLDVYAKIGRSWGRFPLDFGTGVFNWLGSVVPLFMLRKKNGAVVFEVVGNQPVAGAYVIFYSPSGNLKTDFTDKQGRYEVELRPDTYQLRVEAKGYDYPAKVRPAGLMRYGRMYSAGEKVEVTGESDNSPKYAVPMSPGKNVLTRWYRGIAKTRDYIAGLGGAASAYTLLVLPGSRIAVAVLGLIGLYAALGLVLRVSKRNPNKTKE